MLYVLSLLGILFENSLPINGVLVVFTLPFLMFIEQRKSNIKYFYLVVVLILSTLQKDKFIFIFIVFLFYYFSVIIYNIYIDYETEKIIYITIFQLAFYFLLSYRDISLKYSLINAGGFLIMNYIYTYKSNKDTI